MAVTTNDFAFLLGALIVNHWQVLTFQVFASTAPHRPDDSVLGDGVHGADLIGLKPLTGHPVFQEVKVLVSLAHSLDVFLYFWQVLGSDAHQNKDDTVSLNDILKFQLQQLLLHHLAKFKERHDEGVPAPPPLLLLLFTDL